MAASPKPPLTLVIMILQRYVERISEALRAQCFPDPDPDPDPRSHRPFAAGQPPVASPLARSSSARFFLGPFQPQVNDDGVEISVTFKHGEPQEVTKIEYHNVPAAAGCYTTNIFFKSMAVNPNTHRFQGSGHPGLVARHGPARDPGVGRGAHLRPGEPAADPEADLQVRLDHPRRGHGG